MMNEFQKFKAVFQPKDENMTQQIDKLLSETKRIDEKLEGYMVWASDDKVRLDALKVYQAARYIGIMTGIVHCIGKTTAEIDKLLDKDFLEYREHILPLLDEINSTDWPNSEIATGDGSDGR